MPTLELLSYTERTLTTNRLGRAAKAVCCIV